MRAVILSGGKGTRLAPYTTLLPKPLMPIGEMPVLEIVVRQLGYFGFRRITLSVGHQAALIETFFGRGEKFGVQIDYSREDTPLGTAGPLSMINNLKETFLVMNGDILTDLNYGDMLRYHKKNGAFATLGLYRKRVLIDLGVIESDNKGIIENYIEKPTVEYKVSMGIYIFQPEVKEYIPRGRKLDMPDLIKSLIDDKREILGYHFKGYWLDIGRYDDYQSAVELFENQKDRFLY